MESLFTTICFTITTVLLLQVVPNIGQTGFNGVPCRGQCGQGTYCSSPDDYCKCIPGLFQRTENNGTFTCTTDIDECELKIFDCPPDSICVNSHGAYRCACGDGLYKTVNGYCQPDIDECLLGIASCPENTDCRNTLGYYTCVCSSGFTKAQNGTCIEADSVTLAWYWWVGIVFLSLIGIVILLALARCVCNRCDDDDSSAGDLGSDRLSVIYTDKHLPERTTTKELMSLSEPDIESPKCDNSDKLDRTNVTSQSDCVVTRTDHYSRQGIGEEIETVDQALLSNS